MGKKFQFTGAPKTGAPAAPAAPASPGAPAPPGVVLPPPPKLGSAEMAARVKTASLDPLGGPLVPDDQLQAELNRRISVADEGAMRFDQALAIETVAPEIGDYTKALAEESGFRVVNLNNLPRPPHDVVKLLTAEQAKRYMCLPLMRLEDGTVVVAISDPYNTTVIDSIHALLHDRQVELVVAQAKDIAERVEQCYGLGDTTLEDIVEKDEGSTKKAVEAATEINITDMASFQDSSPVVKYVNVLLIKAIKERASDIHIEPFPGVVRIRYRVDGVLREIPSPKYDMLQSLIARIKVMSNMDIAESRLPQDGRIKLMVDGREVDLRCSTMPTANGEAIVMRVLDKSMMMVGIRQIGMQQEPLEKLLHHIEKPNGIILVTGPTGSGKTTTLYAAMAEIKDPGDKLITVEDPVEYEVPGLVQVNVNEGVGLTFARCLRAILRQDPDTVLVGEIRDAETAQISIQASLTGHLVFSTLHTNSAAATVTRLIDMGVQPFLITSSIEAVIGQRLIRTICPTCRKPYRPSPEELEEFNVSPDQVQGYQFSVGEGCHDCGFSGYKGRLGLFELFEINDEIRDLILDQAATDEIHEAAKRNGMQTMREDGWMKICAGLTTFEEVMRETPREIVHVAYEGNEDEEETAAPPPPPSPQAGPALAPSHPEAAAALPAAEPPPQPGGLPKPLVGIPAPVAPPPPPKTQPSADAASRLLGRLAKK